MSDGVEGVRFSRMFSNYSEDEEVSETENEEESVISQYAGMLLEDMMISNLKQSGNSSSSIDVSGWNNSGSRNVNFNFTEKMSARQKSELEQFKANYAKNQSRYQSVAEKTGIPAELVAAIHWRESSGNFNTYMHNGDPLGTPTTHVPAGKLFYDWESSAIDALKSERGSSTLTAHSTDLNAIADFAERYNGLGYRNKGVPSPYVWAGTDKYTSGKYVADGVYDSGYVDQQLGVMLMIKSIM